MGMKYGKEEAIRIYQRLQRNKRNRMDQLTMAQMQLLVLQGDMTTVGGVWSSGMVESAEYFDIVNWTVAGANTISITNEGQFRVDRPAAGGSSNGATIIVQAAASSAVLSPNQLVAGKTYIWEGTFVTDDDNATVVIRDNNGGTNYTSTIGSGIKRIEFTWTAGGNLLQRFSLVTVEKFAQVSNVSIFEKQ